MKHALLSAYGRNWAERYLAMFTIYIDDSGSSPEHKIAIASGIVFPAIKLGRFKSEWDTFLAKEGITDFHSSECLAANPKSQFTGWDEERIKRVFARVRQMTFKYSVRGFCIAIHKQDYDEVMPEDMRKRVGSYYTWALSSVLGFAHDFSAERSVPMEYVFDNAEKTVKREIDDVMAYCERLHPGHYDGHYSFRSRKDVPELQATDLFAWTCYQAARHTRFDQPIQDIAAESWLDYWKAMKGQKWCEAQSLNREGIELWVKNNYHSPEDLAVQQFKEERTEARKPKKISSKAVV
jgi:hypothetical protein